jgi:hypothetical protein
MRTRSVAAALLIAFVPATTSTSALAQTSDDPIVKAARARFNEGVDFYDKGQFENARAAFLQAYALRKHPAVLLNLAQSSLRSGHTLEAARYFEQYLRESAALSAAQRGDAEKGLADARTKLGRLDVIAPAGTEIDVDGEHVGTAPLSDPVDVEPGSHTVKSGSDSKTVTVAAGQVEAVSLEASPAAPVTPAAPSAPEGEEQNVPSPASTLATPPPVAATAEPNHPGLFSPPNTMAPFWIGLGVGVAGGATAIVFAVFKAQANSNADSVSNQIVDAARASGITMTRGLCLSPPSQNFREACQTLQSDSNIVDTNATVANIGLGAGIAGVAFSLGWYLFASKRETTQAATGNSGALVPIVGPGWNGLGYAGSF